MAKKKKHIRKGRDYRTSKNTDGLRRSKPSGYRFRGESNFSKPTQKEIQEHLDHKRDDIYYENRPERSDRMPFSKRGKRFAKGGIVIDENWGNDGSTPSNNKDYNELYAMFPDNHKGAKSIWKQLSENQKEGFLHDLDVTDAASEHIKDSWLEFINAKSEKDWLKNATNWDEMKDGGSVNENDKEVTEERYNDLLGAVPPKYFTQLDGKKVNNGFAVGEAYSHTKKGKAVYTGLYKDGNKYYETLVMFVSKDEVVRVSKDELYKYDNGGELTKEEIVLSKLNEGGEISSYELEKIIERSPCYPVCTVGELKLRKQFLRGCYRKI